MRQLRIISTDERANYHIMVRTAQALFWMASKEFRDEVMTIIETFAQIYCVTIHASACLHNHYHLAITVDRSVLDLEDIKTRFQLLQDQLVHKRTWRKYERKYYQKRFTNLSMFMWEINRRIAVAYNRRHGSTGHFWGARFKSQLVEDGDPMLRVMSYIEQNPVRAGLAEKPTDYPHCSAGRKAKALENGEEPEIEGFGILKKFTGVERLRIWLLIQNYMALVLRTRPGERLPAAPDVLKEIFTAGHAVHWRMEFLKGTPSNWTTQAYGSEAYIKSILDPGS